MGRGSGWGAEKSPLERGGQVVIYHRRLQTALLRSGLDAPDEPPTKELWPSLLAHLSEGFEQAELQLLRHASALEGRQHELDGLLADLAAEHFKLEAVLSVLPQALAALDPEGRCLFASSAFERWLGWSQSELASGEPLKLLQPALGMEATITHGQSFSQRGCKVKTGGGGEAKADLSLHPRYSGDRFLGSLLLLEPASAVLQSAVPLEEGPEELFGMRVALSVADPQRRQSLRHQLRLLGANVLERDAVELPRRLLQATMHGVGFDVVLLDGQNTDALEQLRGEPALAGLPVLAVLESSTALDDDRWSAHLVMPCVVEELAEILAEAMAPSPVTSSYPAVEVSAPLSVLIVEDEPINRMMVEEAVLSFGSEPRAVASAEEAQKALTERSFDVVISDWVMPQMSGPDLCRWVRQGAAPEHHTYFLLLSGKTESDEVAAEVADCGADDYLVKPLNPALLERRLQLASRLSGQQAALRQLAPGAPL